MVFPICLLVGLADPHDTIHAGEHGYLFLVNTGGISLRTQNGGFGALGYHDLDAASLHGLDSTLQLIGGKTGLHNDDHTLKSFLMHKIKPRQAQMARRGPGPKAIRP